LRRIALAVAPRRALQLTRRRSPPQVITTEVIQAVRRARARWLPPAQRTQCKCTHAFADSHAYLRALLRSRCARSFWMRTRI
jgi:hypothetical protein